MPKRPTEEVLMVRLYVVGSPEHRELLLRRLQRWEKLRGATVMQSVEGFGSHGVARGDAAPMVVEFFDSADEAMRVIDDVRDQVDRVVFWPASTVPESL
jgi:PII-like signaling protein